jgi:hypothetical protein
MRAQRVRYIDRPFYHYYQREMSGCHTKNVSKLKDWLRAYENVIDIYEKNNINRGTVDYVKRFMAYHSSNAVEIAIEQKEWESKEYFQSCMRRYEKEYIDLNQSYPERIKRFKQLMNV